LRYADAHWDTEMMSEWTNGGAYLALAIEGAETEALDFGRRGWKMKYSCI
jgi:hypothetical protein